MQRKRPTRECRARSLTKTECSLSWRRRSDGCVTCQLSLSETPADVQNEEAKQARREANKVKLDEPEEDTPGIASLASSSVLTASASIGADGADEDELDVDEADIPELVDTALATLQDVIDKADVVVQVLDARDIQGGRSEFVEKMVTDAGGRFALVVNKIGTWFMLNPRASL